MNQQITSPLPAAVARLLPTHRAAVALLAIDAVLLIIPLVVEWHLWFAFAYVPLLATVVLGVLMSGRGLGAIIGGGLMVLAALVTASATRAVASVERAYVLLWIGMIILIGVGVIWSCLAVWGWFRFFRGRLDTVPPTFESAENATAEHSEPSSRSHSDSAQTRGGSPCGKNSTWTTLGRQQTGQSSTYSCSAPPEGSSGITISSPQVGQT